MGGSGGTSGVNEVYIMCRGGIYERCGDVGIRIGYVGTRRRGEKGLVSLGRAGGVPDTLSPRGRDFSRSRRRVRNA